MFKNSTAIAPFLLLVGLASPVFAQTATPATTPDTAATIDDIVVTAQRREQALQSVPIAIAAVGGEELLRSGVRGTTDLATKVPGLNMPSQRNVLTPYLRGVGTQNGGLGSESAVATYIDGVYIAAPSGNTLSFSNIERVEVLKGPQGTLFGRNATGGLLQIITKTPGFSPQFDANVAYASYDTLSGGFYGSTGLNDQIAVSLAGFSTNQGKGWGKNLTLGNDVNISDEWGLRGKLLYQPNEQAEFVLAADYGERQSDVGISRHVATGTRTVLGTASAGSIYDTQGGEPRDVNFESWGASLTASYDLGFATLKSTTAYREYDNQSLLDQDLTPAPFVAIRASESTKTTQQEFLLSGGRDRLDYAVGLFYFKADNGVLPLDIRSSISGALNTNTFTSGETTSYAAFGQATYSLTDTTRITGGLRYTDEETHGFASEYAQAGHPSPAGTLLRTVDQSRQDRKITYRVALDHDFTDSVLGYASYNRGFKSGAVNIFSPFQPITEPEVLDTYEVGLKSDLFDRMVRLNLSAFYYQYSNIQLSRVLGATQVLINAAESEIKGAELEFSIAPPVKVGRLRIDSAVAYLDSTYSDFPNAPIFIPLPTGGNRTDVVDATGNQSILSPKWTANLSLNYTVPVTGWGDFGINLTYYYNNGFFWQPDNIIKEKAYSLLNGEISLRSADDRWTLAAFGRNMLDEEYSAYYSVSNLANSQTPGAPATYGIRLSYRYGQ